MENKKETIGKVFLFLLLGILLISFASASQKTYKVNEELDLKVTCLNDGYCSNESVCNINVENPDDSLLVTGQNMTNQGSFHNYTITPEQLGKYGVKGFCLDGELSQEINFPFWVTPDGNQIDTGESIMYIWILIILIILVALGIYLSYIIPYQNIMDNNSIEKIVIKITKTKYVKLLTIWLTSGLILLFVTILTGMINNYIQFIEMKGIFTSIYTFLSILGYGTSTVIIWLLFINFWKDILINKQLVKHGKAFIEKNAGSA